MGESPNLQHETDTPHGHYQVWDVQYGGRPARVLYSGQRQTAQSGIALDDNRDLLFDYNQRFYELVSGSLPARLLLIGGGAYTLPIALLAGLPSLLIDVVEFDEGLEAIARRFFGLQSNPRLRLIHDDGRHYLDNNQQAYDMILVDAFLHADTPSSLTNAGAIQQYRRNLTPNGIVAMNTISAFYGRDAEVIKTQLAAYRVAFNQLSVFPASHALSLQLAQNFLLIAQAGKFRPLGEYLRYPELDLASTDFLAAD